MIRQIYQEEYTREREHLNRFEQANYENFEKTILTLSSAFFVFSVSFLGLYTTRISSAPGIELYGFGLLLGSWICFASSILLILLSMLFGGLAFRYESKKLDDALKRKGPISKKNAWTTIIFFQYLLAGLTFSTGIVLIIVFCAYNRQLFSI
jgi:hypothetical protein